MLNSYWNLEIVPVQLKQIIPRSICIFHCIFDYTNTFRTKSFIAIRISDACVHVLNSRSERCSFISSSQINTRRYCKQVARTERVGPAVPARPPAGGGSPHVATGPGCLIRPSKADSAGPTINAFLSYCTQNYSHPLSFNPRTTTTLDLIHPS